MFSCTIGPPVNTVIAEVVTQTSPKKHRICWPFKCARLRTRKLTYSTFYIYIPSTRIYNSPLRGLQCPTASKKIIKRTSCFIDIEDTVWPDDRVWEARRIILIILTKGNIFRLREVRKASPRTSRAIEHWPTDCNKVIDGPAELTPIRQNVFSYPCRGTER